MVLYTNEPFEAIFPQSTPVSTKSIQVPEGIVEASETAGGIFCVSRLISTDPRAYLNPKYAPGHSISTGRHEG